MKRLIIALAFVVAAPRAADAFCGFYVATGDKPMFNDATQVVLMRMGTRTVLSMQNNYKGPTEAFAMVIPVPVVLAEKDVKILSKEVFERVDAMSAPRLVEYWEMDPCAPASEDEEGGTGMRRMALEEGKMGKKESDHGVTIEAQFTVGEYQIVILSAKEATGLDTWLREQKYEIPKGAEPLLRPYVEGGSKFFVAKVDPTKVKFVDGRAALSPLRFHYDSDDFSLPIRLGLANSAGTQDLIVNILSPGQRYEVANYKNVTIPTNITVKNAVREKFAAFYVALFDATLEKHPGAVVTEYAWDASTCDPCPGPTLDGSDFVTLGGDVIDPKGGRREYGYVLTRLHARYGKDLTEDLRFKQASPIAGGREHLQDGAKLEEGARPEEQNNFQARYAIRHAWDKPITCSNPVRNRWGGPDGQPIQPPRWGGRGGRGPTGQYKMKKDGPSTDPIPATGLAFAKRDELELAEVVAHDIPELGLAAKAASAAVAPVTPATPNTAKQKKGCGCATTDASSGLTLAALLILLRRRKR